MAELDDQGADAAAEKAYAAATEVLPPKADPEPVVVKAATMPRKIRKPVAAKAAKAPAKTAPALAAVEKAPVTKTKRAPKKNKVVAKPAAKRVVVRKPKSPAAIPASPLKDKIMSKSSTFTQGIKSAVADAQDKAKVAYAKGAAAVGGYTEFTKGNVEALVESGKIFASGLQKMGVSLAADTKESADTFATEVKGFAAAKTPAELLQMQSEMLHRQFDKAVAYNSKASEAALKLVNDAMAPVAGRLSLTMDKIRKAA